MAFLQNSQAVAYEAGGGGPSAWKIQGKLCFQGKLKLLKNPERKKIFQYSEKFQGKFCFSGKAQVAQKSWM